MPHTPQAVSFRTVQKEYGREQRHSNTRFVAIDQTAICTKIRSPANDAAFMAGVRSSHTLCKETALSYRVASYNSSALIPLYTDHTTRHASERHDLPRLRVSQPARSQISIVAISHSKYRFLSKAKLGQYEAAASRGFNRKEEDPTISGSRAMLPDDISSCMHMKNQSLN